MALWRFSDGTEFQSPNRVTGSGRFADELRYELAAGPRWTSEPQPAESMPVDFENEDAVGGWLRNLARLIGVRLVSGPESPSVQFGATEPGRLY